MENEENVKHDLEMIRDELFNLPFVEAGRELIVKFKSNYSKLKEFMEKIDKDVSKLSVFSDQ